MGNPKFELSKVIKRVNDGDESAFHELYNRYYGPVFQTALAFLKNEDVAEDVCVEVFRILADKIGTLVPEEFEERLRHIGTCVTLAKHKGLPTDKCWTLSWGSVVRKRDIGEPIDVPLTKMLFKFLKGTDNF